MTDRKVISLRPDLTADTRALLAHLDYLADEVEAGHVVGMVYAIVAPNGDVTPGKLGELPTAFVNLAIDGMKFELLSATEEQD